MKTGRFLKSSPSHLFALTLVLICAIPSVFGQAVSVTVTNATRGGTNFVAGDQVSITIAGPPNSAISYVQSIGGVQLGSGAIPLSQTTGPSGVVTLASGSVPPALAGANSETWCVGGSQQCPSMCSASPSQCATVSFLVVPLVPSGKEYIHLGSRVLAIEYSTPNLPVEQLVTPSPAIPTNNLLNFVVQDINSTGVSSSNNVTNVGLLINGPFNGQNACYIELLWNGSTGTGGLYADNGTTFQTSFPASNSQCTLNSVTYGTTAGNVLQWQAQLSFQQTGSQATFLNAGPTVYAYAQTSSGQSEWDSITTLSGGTPPLMPATKVGVVRPSTGVSNYFWIEDVNGNETIDGFAPREDRMFAVGGVCGDILITGDWNGDGHTKAGIYRVAGSPAYSAFILDSNGDGQITASDKTYYSFTGSSQAGDVPVTGDWNGNGITKIGLYRNGAWYLDMNGDGVFTAGVDAFFYFGGLSGDIPVTGDWSGTGTTKVGIFRQGYYWILDTNGNQMVDAGDQQFAFGGIAGDQPVVGDWSGTGKTNVGVFRQNYFWVLDANGLHTGNVAFPFGGVQVSACSTTLYDKPVTGRW